MNLAIHSVRDNMPQRGLLRRRLTFRLSRTCGGRSHKAQSDLAAAQQARTKLIEVIPHYREQATAFAELKIKENSFAFNFREYAG